jgi:hypothetical protein
MTTRRDWQAAFLKQARTDWDAYEKAEELMWPICHRLHFLQMATEKLGKALLVAAETKLDEITHSHLALVKFLRVVSNNLDLHLKLGLTKSQLKAQFKGLLPIAHEIEILAPALAQEGPNPEYPWVDKAGRICIPVDYSFPLTKLLQSHQGIRLLKYIEYFLAEFEELFL